MKYKKVYMADFETTKTTTYKDTGEKLESRAVWNATIRQVPTRKGEKDHRPFIFASIDDMLKMLHDKKENAIIYFHNLPYDGAFIVSRLHSMGVKGQMAYFDERKGEEVEGAVLNGSNLKRNSYSYLIDEMGRWFAILYKDQDGLVYEFRDSVKLFPFSVKDLGKQLKGLKFSQVDYGKYWKATWSDRTDVKKGYLDHSKERPLDEPISPLEAKYSCEDVAIVYYLLKSFIIEDLDGEINDIPLTIGSKTLQDFFMYFTPYKVGDEIWVNATKEKKDGTIVPYQYKKKLKRKDIVRMGREAFESKYPDLTECILTESFRANNLSFDVKLSFEWPMVEPYVVANPKVITSTEERNKIEDESIKQALNKLFPLTAFDYIQNGYGGGHCDVNEKFQGKILTTNPEDFKDATKEVIAIEGGCVADANSLYPSVAISEGGYRYAFGLPTMYDGVLPEHANEDDYTYYVRFNGRLKGMRDNPFHEGYKYRPWVQIKGNLLYEGTSHLETTDYFDGQAYHEKVLWDNDVLDTIHTFTMYKTDFERLLEEYVVEDLEIIDSLVFETTLKSPFDEYYRKLSEIKAKSKGVDPIRYLITKLYMNSLYGKFASSPKSNYKVIDVDANGALKFQKIASSGKRAGYIAIGAAITANGRAETLNQINRNIPYFCYADTDSIHCCCKPERLIENGLPIHPTKLNYWDIEKEELYASLFDGAKRYVEYLTPDFFEMHCAGMTGASVTALKLTTPKMLTLPLYELQNMDEYKELQPNVQEWILERRDKGEAFTIDKFGEGLKVAGKLQPKQVRGGVDLVPIMFEMKRKDVRSPLRKIEEKKTERALAQKEKRLAKQKRRKMESLRKEKDLSEQPLKPLL
ncbi:MAG: hypothetical protein HDR88_18165 [Bacteroides sp.]|nr:hypothetical protein [Bacteroides sp.]